MCDSRTQICNSLKPSLQTTSNFIIFHCLTRFLRDLGRVPLVGPVRERPLAGPPGGISGRSCPWSRRGLQADPPNSDAIRQPVGGAHLSLCQHSRLQEVPHHGASGAGRYDVVMKPLKLKLCPACLITYNTTTSQLLALFAIFKVLKETNAFGPASHWFRLSDSLWCGRTVCTAHVTTMNWFLVANQDRTHRDKRLPYFLCFYYFGCLYLHAVLVLQVWLRQRSWGTWRTCPLLITSSGFLACGSSVWLWELGPRVASTMTWHSQPFSL